MAERERIETSQQHHDERTHVALGAARMGIWEVDLVSSRVTWSPTMADVYGRTVSEAPTTRAELEAMTHDEDRDGVVAEMARAIADRDDFHREFRICWPDGSVHWVANIARVSYDDAGQSVRVSGVCMAIDDRRLLEEQIRQTQTLAAVGQIAGTFAHDFNNLLTAILCYGNLLARALEPGSTQRHDAEEIVRAAESATALTMRLQSLARPPVLQPSPEAEIERT